MEKRDFNIRRLRRTLVSIFMVSLLVSCGGVQPSDTSSIDELSSESESSSPSSPFVPIHSKTQKYVQKISTFPTFPKKHSYYDYGKKAEEIDAALFSFANNKDAVLPVYLRDDPSSWSPIGFWVDQIRESSDSNPLINGYQKRSFGLPSYVGDNRVSSSGSEPMTYISSVLGSTLAGIDKSNQAFGDETYNFVEMLFSAYDTGCGLVHNVGQQGQSFWYDLFPQIMFARLLDRYGNIEYMKDIVLRGADEWLATLPYFVDDQGNSDYEYVGCNVSFDSPTKVGDHIEPPNGGLAYIFYTAYKASGDRKYLEGAKTVLDYLQDYQKNPNYEAMCDYAPYVAAILNSEEGTDYDVGKFIDFLFDADSSFRPGWCVMDGSFGNYAVDGLVGQSGDYAFSMNSFHLPMTLAPLVKYDTRYADAIGKYLLNVASNGRWFFPDSLSLSHQSSASYLPFDPSGSLPYEGFRNSYNGVNGYAMGDATAMFGESCDISVYSSGFVGCFGSMISKTNVDGIFQFDLNVTDQFGRNDYPTYLIYNPYSVEKRVSFEAGDSECNILDLTESDMAAYGVSGQVFLSVPAESSKVVSIIPADEEIISEGNSILVSGKTVSIAKPSVNLTNLVTRQSLTSSSNIEIAYQGLPNDDVEHMEIRFGSILAYSGDPIEEFSYDKSVLPDTDYTIRVTITTRSGKTDSYSKRIVAR